MSTTVLFVDDQPEVLHALRRTLHSQRTRWEVKFAGGGSEALDMLEQSSVDIIVTDMRMPGMSGVELLAEAAATHPRTVRLVLSGQTERKDAFHLITASHQFLPKPCDAEVLINTVSRIDALRSELADERMQTEVGRLRALPIPIEEYDRLMRELTASTPSLENVAEIANGSASLAAKLLQAVNSGYFSQARKTSNIVQATNQLGIEEICELVVTSEIISKHEHDAFGGIQLASFSRHNRRCARSARAIAVCEGFDQEAANRAYTAGLLHDIGKLVIASRQVQAAEGGTLGASDCDICDLPLDKEITAFGADHAAMGAYLLGLWGLEDPIIDAVACHHSPAKCGSSNLGVSEIVFVAEALMECVVRGYDEDRFLSMTDEQYLESLGVLDRLPVWHEMLATEMTELAP